MVLQVEQPKFLQLFPSTIRWLYMACEQVNNSKCSVSLSCLKFKIPGLLPGIAFSLLYLQVSDVGINVIIATHPNLRNWFPLPALGSSSTPHLHCPPSCQLPLLSTSAHIPSLSAFSFCSIPGTSSHSPTKDTRFISWKKRANLNPEGIPLFFGCPLGSKMLDAI